jgi:hypothetical protein
MHFLHCVLLVYLAYKQDVLWQEVTSSPVVPLLTTTTPIATWTNNVQQSKESGTCGAAAVVEAKAT